jgi:hypothetical protein
VRILFYTNRPHAVVSKCSTPGRHWKLQLGTSAQVPTKRGFRVCVAQPELRFAPAWSLVNRLLQGDEPPSSMLCADWLHPKLG